jgi:hypothetical protein
VADLMIAVYPNGSRVVSVTDYCLLRLDARLLLAIPYQLHLLTAGQR